MRCPGPYPDPVHPAPAAGIPGMPEFVLAGQFAAGRLVVGKKRAVLPGATRCHAVPRHATPRRDPSVRRMSTRPRSSRSIGRSPSRAARRPGRLVRRPVYGPAVRRRCVGGRPAAAACSSVRVAGADVGRHGPDPRPLPLPLLCFNYPRRSCSSVFSRVWMRDCTLCDTVLVTSECRS